MSHQDSNPPTIGYTPGPYCIHQDRDGCNDYFHIVERATERTLASILFWDCDAEEMERSWANARLFATAPELLEVLKELLNIVISLPLGDLPLELYAVEQKAHAVITHAEKAERSGHHR